MQKPGKILVVSQHYVPDPTTTAVYMAAIAEGLAVDNEVVVLSGSLNSGIDRRGRASPLPRMLAYASEDVPSDSR